MSTWFRKAGDIVGVTGAISHYYYYYSTKGVFKGDFQKADPVTFLRPE